MKTGIFYGSTTGNTENAAELFGKWIKDAQVQSIADGSKDDLENYDLLILGTSTWGWGEIQDNLGRCPSVPRTLPTGTTEIVGPAKTESQKIPSWSSAVPIFSITMPPVRSKTRSKNVTCRRSTVAAPGRNWPLKWSLLCRKNSWKNAAH